MALERVLASPAFRNSKQCQKFLRYVAEHTLAGQEDQLKERSIGIEVFGRTPDYDTGEDPVVRVRATEIRKRLAQYHQEAGHEGEVRLDLPAGSYRVEFHWPDPAAGCAPPVPAPVEVPPRPLRWWLWAIPVLAAAALVAAWVASRPQVRAQTVLEKFWSPAMTHGKPVLLYCGQPVVYFLSRELHAKYGSPERPRTATPLPLPPDAVLRGRDIIPVTEQFVGIGNAHTAALLAAHFARLGKPVELRYASDVSFSDLRSSPAVMIGAFSNTWTLEMTSQLRYVFETEGGRRLIRDRTSQKSWRLENQAPDGKTPEDYALVSRLIDSATGQMLVAAAGITQYGTRAAGEFLVDNALMDETFGKLDAGWSGKNQQVLLHTTVYKGTPARPKVLAAHIW